MNLLVQPLCGIAPIVEAIEKAASRVEIVIFRFDTKEVQRALEAAVQRGVAVHALIANTNRGGEKRLRKLELALLERGVTVSRTGDDFVRYHGKLMVVDGKTLHLFGFNYTSIDVKSRSFGLVTNQPDAVQEALRVFEADTLRQPYVPGSDALVVSPENARAKLAMFVKGARKELLIYDPKIADGPMIRLIQERAKAGVSIRILGRLTRATESVLVAKLPKLRLHVRAILRDGEQLFVGSQSLRPLELDRRREVGLICDHPRAIKQFRAVFEDDWSLTDHAKAAAEDPRETDEIENPNAGGKPAEKPAEKKEGEHDREAAAR